MKLLIVGATGPTGRELVSQAAAQGHEVTAFVRDAGKAGFLPPVRTAVGDVLEAASLGRALAGQEAIISSLGSRPSGPFGQVTVLSEGTRNLVAAMHASGVSRYVGITGIGAGESSGHGPWFFDWLIKPLVLRGAYQDKTRQEEIVRNSGLEWTLVRPAILRNGVGLGLGALRVLTSLAGAKVGSVSRSDVAAFCLQELADGRYKGQAPVITN